VLKTLLGSASRAKLLSHFLLHPGEAFHVRELGRILDEPASNLLRDLRRLQAVKLLDAERVGNQVRYTLSRKHPLYEDLQRLVLRTAAADTVLLEALRPLKDIELAFLFGSFAKGEADASSDMDLMIIGGASDRSLAPAIARAEKALGREVSYTRFTREEAKKKAQQPDSFIRSVFAGPKIVFVGRADDELFALAQGKEDL
jgi:predicted nucleotidyltransferase